MNFFPIAERKSTFLTKIYTFCEMSTVCWQFYGGFLNDFWIPDLFYRLGFFSIKVWHEKNTMSSPVAGYIKSNFVKYFDLNIAFVLTLFSTFI
jgi:hypothetical protein